MTKYHGDTLFQCLQSVNEGAALIQSCLEGRERLFQFVPRPFHISTLFFLQTFDFAHPRREALFGIL